MRWWRTEAFVQVDHSGTTVPHGFTGGASDQNPLIICTGAPTRSGVLVRANGETV